jgi:hypothetical protein
MRLVLLDDNQVRRNALVKGAGPDNRLARAMVAAAHDTGYFDNKEVVSRNAVEGHYRQERIEAYRKSWPQLRGSDVSPSAISTPTRKPRIPAAPTISTMASGGCWRTSTRSLMKVAIIVRSRRF